MIEKVKSTSTHYKLLREVLGNKNMPTNVDSSFDFIRVATKGVDASVVRYFRSYFDLSRESTASKLNVSEPTLYRWTKAEKRLDRNFSIKLFEVADLFLYGTGVFDDKAKFLKWLELPNTAIGGMRPIELIEMPGGVSKVRDVLGRIEYGVFS